jgi:hypothetical protein
MPNGSPPMLALSFQALTHNGNLWILPIATLLFALVTYNLILPQPMCHLPFCHLQKLQLIFTLQVPFLPSLLVTPPIWWFTSLNTLQEKFCGPSVNAASIFVYVKWSFEHSMKATQFWYPSSLIPLVALAPLPTDSFSASNLTLPLTHFTSKVILP